MFDAIWTAALALNKTNSKLREKNLSLKDFSYNDEYGISDTIYGEILKLEFFGLSVSVNCGCTYIISYMYMYIYVIYVA